MVMGSQPGEFMPQEKTPVGPIPTQIEKADFNKDGKLDLAILSVGTTANAAIEYAQSLHVLAGNGNGGFVSPFTIALKTEEAAPRFTVGDFNGDGWPDLALLEPDSGRIRIALNTQSEAAPTFQETAAPIPSPDLSRCLAAADFTGDGRDDFVVALEAGDGGRVDVLVSDGAGGAAPGGSRPIANSPSCLAVGRVDGDAAFDVAVGGAGGAGVAEACVLLGSGSGTLGEPVATPLAAGPSDIAIGDLDGKGYQDLVLTHPGENMLFSVLVTEPPVPGVFLRGDANADGEIDISDAVTALVYLFVGGGTDCLEALDSNGDLEVDITDPIFLLNFMFLGGENPPAPFPEPGLDPNPEALGCERSGGEE